MNSYMIQKAIKSIGPDAMKFLVQNKEKIIKILPHAVCGAIIVQDIYKSGQQKEKDKLYQKHIQKTDAMIKDLEKKAGKVDYLEDVNKMLTDTVIELRKSNLVEA